jgi:hypothetical protein
MKIRTGSEYLYDLELATINAKKSFVVDLGNEKKLELSIIGTSLSALYQAGTCYRKCHNNGHVLEALAGRTHNLGLGAFNLARDGLYDEAFNLIRGIGEIANLIAALSQDENTLKNWLSATPSERIKKFGPKKIRDMLKKKGVLPLPADDEWYGRYCENYTHVSPKTRPGSHGRDGKDWVGPVYQPNGMSNTIKELVMFLSIVAMMICAFFKFEDLMQELDKLTKAWIARDND